jgi:methionine-S-sulfoxide reductase
MQQIILAAGKSKELARHFEEISGVISTTLGFTGGTTENPTAEEIASQVTGHAEAVLVEFDAEKVSVESLIRQFLRLHDPTALNRQGSTIGSQFRSAIFYVTDTEKEIAEKVMAEVQPDFKQPIVTQIELAGPFYAA